MKSQALDEPRRAFDEALTAAFPGASVCRLMNILIRSGIGATVVWSLAIVAGGQSSPRTSSGALRRRFGHEQVNGRQFIVVAVGGRDQPGELVALSLR